METQTFSTTVGSISFTLLGLWWVVVMGREAWLINPARRRMAYAISLRPDVGFLRAVANADMPPTNLPPG